MNHAKALSLCQNTYGQYMKTFTLAKEVMIHAPLHAVWTFFSNPKNLQKISPGYMKFKIIRCPEVAEIFDGMLIEYRISPVLKIPLKWVSEIKAVKPLQFFTDVQIVGPYTHWEHIHSFKETSEGTLMLDHVTYRLPLGRLGTLAHDLFVKKQLHDIFSYREDVIKKEFPAKNLY
jgi:ligand-binding SRPBCC domain-containing protein